MTTKTGTAVAEVGHAEVARPADAPSIEGMMQLAVQQGTDGVEALERLVALKERMEDRNARMAFLDALAAFQDAVAEVPKHGNAKVATKGGGSYSYSFARLEDITRAIREPLRAHGLSYSWDTEPGKDGELVVVCVLRHTDGHEERSSFPVPTDTQAAMSAAQKNGAALTYGRRQSLIAVLGLTAADDDNDAPLRNVAKITDAQVADLEALIEEVGADRPKFLKYMRVDALSDITTADFDRALNSLERKRAAR